MRRLPIANPCDEDWDAMRPEGSRRFCQVCSKSVHDLSSMTPGQARTLVASGRRLCVRYLHDGEDIVHLAPAPTQGSERAARIHGVAAGLVAGLLASCTPHGNPAAERFEWEEAAVTADPGVLVIPDAPQPTGDEPCGLEPEAEPEPDTVAPMRKLMGKPMPIKGRMRVEEMLGDGL